MSQIVSFESALKHKRAADVHRRWIAFYSEQEHQSLLDALVYEHENNFPLRSSADPLDHEQHRALLEVLQERAHTEFLKNLLVDIQNRGQAVNGSEVSAPSVHDAATHLKN